MSTEPASSTSPKRRRPARAASPRSTRPRAGSPAARRCWSATTSASRFRSLPEAAELCRPDRRARRSWRRPRPRSSSALFAEHVDLCSYRYDAWLLGLVNQHIADAARRQARHETSRERGLYLGAYAWVEDLRLRPTSARARRSFRPDLAAQFPGGAPLMSDPQNGGYIHAPSMPHADAAAVLRSGYLANASRRPTRRRWRSTSPPTGCASRSRCSRASATVRASARCSATSSSAACTTTTRSPRSTSSSTRCARRSRWSPTRWRRRRRPRRADRGDRGAQRARRPQAGRPDHEERRHRLSVRPGRPAGGDGRREQTALDAEATGAARRLRRHRRPRAGRGRAPGGAGQLRSRRQHPRRLHDGQLPAGAGGRQTPPRRHRADPSRRRAPPPRPRRAGRRDAARPGRAGRRRLARRRAAAARSHRLHGGLERPGHARRRNSTRSRWPTSACARSMSSTCSSPTTCRR